jgi:hypothetical protein
MLANWKKSNLLAFIFGIGLCLAILMVCELSCYFLNRSRFNKYFEGSDVQASIGDQVTSLKKEGCAKNALPTSFRDLKVIRPVVYFEHRPDLVDASKKFERWVKDKNQNDIPNLTTHSKLLIKGTNEAIYDVVITTDADGRRTTTGQDDGERSHHLLLIGCSFVFGEGVNDDETLPSFVAKILNEQKMPRTKVYNLGEMGSSPAHVIERIQKNYLWRNIKESQGQAVYVFFNDHFNRVFGRMSAVGTWGADLPYIFEDEPGHFKVNGSFAQERPFYTRLSRYLASLEFTHFFHLDFPPRFTRFHFEQYAKIILQMKNEYLNRFPGQRFAVAFYPGSVSSLSSYLIPELEKLGISYLDYTPFELSQYTMKPTQHRYDGHPSAEAHRLWGEVLARDLQNTD